MGRVGQRQEGWEWGRGDRDAVIVPDFMEVRNALSGCFPGAAGEGEAGRGGAELRHHLGSPGPPGLGS